MNIGVYPRLILTGLSPDRAFAEAERHINSLTDHVVRLNNEVDTLKRELADSRREVERVRAAIGQR